MKNLEQSVGRIARLIKNKKPSEAIDLLLTLDSNLIDKSWLRGVLLNLQQIPGDHMLKLKPKTTDLSDLEQLYKSGDLEGVVENVDVLLLSYPFSPMLHNVAGSALQELKQYKKAIQRYESSLELNTENPQLHFNIGEALAKLGERDAAKSYYKTAIELLPDFAAARVGLGKVLVAENLKNKAEEQFRLAVKIDSNYEEALLQLAKLFVEAEHPDAALNLLNKIEIDNNNLARELLATAYHQQGRHLESLNEFRELSKADPNHKNWNTQLFAANYLEDISLEQHFTMAKCFADSLISDVSRIYSSWDCEICPERLRVGIVSGDFYEHVVGRMIHNLIHQLKDSDTEFLAFSTNEVEDSISNSLKKKFSNWVSISSVSGFEQSAEVIHNFAPNILIDLNGHTKFNALPVFFYRPAPVQISWLGDSGTTGVPGIDYKLADPYVVSSEEEKFYSEKIWRLPDCFLCPIAPLDAGSISSLPALSKGYILFGSQNRLEKINSAVIECWSKILSSVPKSCLLLKNFGGDQFYVGKKIKEQFLSNGIDQSRLIFEDRSDRSSYFESYRQIDIALDTFPFTGGVTTTDALWMGVPVITRAGRGKFISHQGESILHNAGLSHFIAKDEADYVVKAIDCASDLSRLAEFRLGARDFLSKTTLYDSKRFAANFNEALKAIWKDYSNSLA